ncbi:type I-MYXAN CRISPR-associated protein Cas5/Cmx5/DevS [Thermogemmata fonticola]|uniref:Type I-MYXAN CRISPR-associated protein Cas5/Cmx5/DevS n=1 Tax=Thermogemmata fonticola TaxID=2755323 RepID=A0A7V8VGK4_9BACT|nr:type I-MYXAN CRISPR-associated protein Cas5/Cmx5/DevS [Thermogemmata fonticola]MBA2227427.1 type I-MYXAN CRISPR-associated protein Cas5/Cmx5/DevS [Thermogemmata fonticola]
MLGIFVTVPVTCFRRLLSREYLETEPLPPPSTCYGFLLSLVGETERQRHVGCRLTAVNLNRTARSVALRTVWRWKEKQTLPGCGRNIRPDYQQLLTGASAEHPFVELLLWLDSAEEQNAPPHLEERVQQALIDPRQVSRFGGLSLGESTHLVDEVCLWERVKDRYRSQRGRAFLLAERGRYTWPVWADHVASARTRYAVGNWEDISLDQPPEVHRLPRILPP